MKVCAKILSILKYMTTIYNTLSLYVSTNVLASLWICLVISLRSGLINSDKQISIETKHFSKKSLVNNPDQIIISEQDSQGYTKVIWTSLEM